MSTPASSAREVTAQHVVDGLKQAGVEIVTALPEGTLTPTFVALAQDPDITYIQAASELDLPGIAVGAYLGGKRAMMMMENSGIRQACEPLARLIYGHRAPMVMMTSHRGDLGETHWWGHGHGLAMEGIFDALEIVHWKVRRHDEIQHAIADAFVHADTGQTAVALVMGGECVGGRA